MGLFWDEIGLIGKKVHWVGKIFLSRCCSSAFDTHITYPNTNENDLYIGNGFGMNV